MEILFVLVLGLMVLGPRRLHTMLAHVMRAKAQFEIATRGMKSQLASELDTQIPISKAPCVHESVVNRQLFSGSEP
jgi:Sec-independent protein translocase protein TatA